MFAELTDAEKGRFMAIRDSEYTNFALVRSHLDGEDVAVIAVVSEAEDGDTLIVPVAVLVTEQIMSRLADPTGEEVRDVLRAGEIPGPASPGPVRDVASGARRKAGFDGRCGVGVADDFRERGRGCVRDAVWRLREARRPDREDFRVRPAVWGER